MARKSRNYPIPRDKEATDIQIKQDEISSSVLKSYSTALYIRLSKEDGGKNNQYTIENQKALLKGYVTDKAELQIYDTYIDNGFSGTNFDRPRFRQMLDDIKAGKVNCVIVKDLSRFGRNYLEAGNYIEKIFPFLNVRFISVTDNLDTLHIKGSEDGLTVPLKNIINEIYAKDISRKVSSAIDIKKQEGRHAGGVAPFGYRKSDTVKGVYEVDEEAAKVVRYIFHLRAQNYGYCSIVKDLNAKGIKSPSAYRFEKGIVKNKRLENVLWKRYAIEDMLHDGVYLGNMVRGKTKSAFHKGEKRHRVRREDWIVIKGTHAPIISQQLFDEVQSVNEQKSHIHQENVEMAKERLQRENLFVGKLFCGDCGMAMGYTRGNTNSISYYCPNYKENGELGCRRKFIGVTELEKAVLGTIQAHLHTFLDFKETVQQLNKSAEMKKKRSRLEEALADLDMKKAEYQKRISTLYLDYKSKLFTIEEYYQMKEEYTRFLAECETLITEKKNSSQTMQENYGQDFDLTAVALRFSMEELTRSMIETMIEKIEVFPQKKIHITFRYMDQFELMEKAFTEKGLSMEVTRNEML